MTGQSSDTGKERFCKRVKWRVIPFFIFFFITVAVLLGVYRFRSDSSPTGADHSSRHSHRSGALKNRNKSTKNGWEEGRTNDRWLIVSDGPNIRQYVCSLVEISADLEWRTLVVGNNVTCCRKSCVLMDDAKLKTLNYEILNLLGSGTKSDEGLRSVGYLYAMQHGARHIFDAYPETYTSAQIDLETFKKEMHHQLQSLALNVALGLVSERPYVKRVQNPYAHFGRPDLWTEGFRRNNQRYIHNHIYRICEVRPPSIEKFLDTDDGYYDRAAPALTLPGSTVAPFSSKNTLYSIEAFWGLVLLPTNDSSPQQIPSHLLRTLWNQGVLGDIAGSMKLSLANVSTLQKREKTRKDPGELREPDGLASFLLKWSCSTRSSLSCIRDLFQNMFQFHYISSKSLAFVESWITDLQRSHYLEPPVIPRRRGSMNPCLGADGLYGVAFYPALQPRAINLVAATKKNASLERYIKEEALLDVLNRAHSELLRKSESDGLSVVVAPRSSSEVTLELKSSKESSVNGEENPQHQEFPISHRNAKGFDATDEMPLLREFTENVCPGYSQLLPHASESQLKNVLLIVAMTSLRYDMIPMFEVIYREQFSNILYCGGPHDSIEIFLRKYQLSEDRSFSFLPVHSKYTYECLLGALEMGYNVDGWIMTTDDALINSWNVPRLDISKVWYGGDGSIKVNITNWRSLDPGGQKLPRSLDGVQKVLEFLKSSLIRSTHPDSSAGTVEFRNKREAEIISTGDDLHIHSPIPVVTDDGELYSLTGGHEFKIAVSEPVESHTHDDELLFDLVELKPIAASSEPTVQRQADQLPSLKYEVESNLNETAQVTVELASEVDDSNRETEDNLYVYHKNITEEVDSLEEVEISLDEEDAEETLISEEEAERPVAEVLRKLLVATRNTTSKEMSENDSDEGNTSGPDAPSTDLSSDINSSSVNITLNVSTVSLETPVDDSDGAIKGDEIFRLEEDDWVKPNASSVRENPVIDLFLHAPVTTSTPESTSTSSSNTEQLEQDSLHHSTDVVVDSRSADDGVVFHEPTHENNTSQTTHGHSPLDPTESAASATPSSTDVEHSPVSEEKPSSSLIEEERRSADLHVDDTLSSLQEIYSLIQENLGVPVGDLLYENQADSAFYGGDRTPYRLNPKSIHQFHCERGTNLEFCKVSSEFLYQLSENSGKEFRLTYDNVPMYFIPKQDQLKFYLLSNLMLQHGVTDEIAVPLILSGLSSEQDRITLEKSFFGDVRASSATGEFTPSKYPLFNSDAAVLYPVDLNSVISDSKIQKIFCLKYLLRIFRP